MSKDNFLLIAILFLVSVIAVMSIRMYTKRRQEIIKLLIKKDALPLATPGTTWVENGPCFMKDGKTGKVNGNDCIMLQVL